MWVRLRNGSTAGETLLAEGYALPWRPGQRGYFHLGAYGEWKENGWFVDGTAQAALFGQTITRHSITGAGGTSATPVGRTRLSGSGVEADLRAGHGVRAGERHGDRALYRHHGALAEYQCRQRDGAGIFGLNLPASGLWQFEVGPGLRFSSAPVQTTSGTLRVKTDISYGRLMGDNAHLTNIELLGRPIAASSAAVGRDLLRVGAHVISSATADASAASQAIAPRSSAGRTPTPSVPVSASASEAVGRIIKSSHGGR